MQMCFNNNWKILKKLKLTLLSIDSLYNSHSCSLDPNATFDLDTTKFLLSYHQNASRLEYHFFFFRMNMAISITKLKVELQKLLQVTKTFLNPNLMDITKTEPSTINWFK